MNNLKDGRDDLTKPSPLGKNPLKSILFGASAGLTIGSLVGLFIGLTYEPNGQKANPAFEKLTTIFGSRFLTVFLLSAVAFSLLGLSLTVFLWLLTWIQSENK